MRWLTAIVLLAATAHCGPRPIVEKSVGDGRELDAVALAGKQKYDQYCKLCHGANGEGYSADNANQLANQAFLSTASDSFLYIAIEQGRPGTPMSAFGAGFGGPLGADDIRKIIAYLRNLQHEPPIRDLPERVDGDPAAGEELFGSRCASCHGERGEGKTAMSVSNPAFLMSASDGFIRHAIEHGRPGTLMPAFGRLLTGEQIDDLTAFVRSLARPLPKGVSAGELPPSFDQVVINPDGPEPEFPPLREGRYLPADAVRRELERGARMVLLDARPTSDWLRAHIPGALPVPYYDAQRMTAKLPRDGTWIISYCGCPHAASGQVMDGLRAAGFPNTAVIDEGIFVWIQRNYPITYGRTETLGPR